MKKMLLFLLMIVPLFSVRAQNVPNRGFEAWETRELYEDPVSWYSSNAFTVKYKGITDTLLLVEKSEEAYSGEGALYLHNEAFGEDTLPAFVICQGYVSGDYPDLQFVGGFPYTGQPDSLTGYFRYDLPEEDTLILVVAFKRGGEVQAVTWLALTGTREGWQRKAFALNVPAEAPDTAFVGIAATTPWDPRPGGKVWVDRLAFDDDSTSIPNGDFEAWEPVTYTDPVGWESANWVTAAMRSKPMCTPTQDAHGGELALRLETVSLDMFDSHAGIVSSGELMIESIEGGFPVQFTPTAVSGYYKYFPATADDKAQVVVIYSRWDEDLGERDRRFNLFELEPVDVYSPFRFVVGTGDFVPDTVNIVFASGRMFSGSLPPVGSVLYVDDVWLEHSCGYADTIDLIPFTDTTICAGTTLTLDAGPGYTDYLWSDNSTAQTLTVSDSGVYSVTVTDTRGCTLTDEVTVHVESCNAVTGVHGDEVQLWPNPTGGQVYLSLPAGTGEVRITVTNLVGQRLVEQRRAAAPQLSLDLSALRPGLYLVRVSWHDGEKVLRIIRR